MRDLLTFIDGEEKAILNKAEGFYKCLTHLRYEGKVSRGKNVKAAIKAVKEFRELVQNHRDLQEGVIFPFLATHIPKHESVIQFLRADHQELQRSRLKLEACLQKLSKKVYESLQDGGSQETGVYFVCLLRHHIDLENKCVHQAIRSELRKDEQVEVKKRINRWLTRHHDGVADKKPSRLTLPRKKAAGSHVRVKK